MWSIQSQPSATLHQLVDHILAAGELSRQDHLQLTSILLAEQNFWIAIATKLTAFSITSVRVV